MISFSRRLVLVFSVFALSCFAADRAAEDLAGPPAVTAKSWIIADLDHGMEIAALQADEPRKAASTTKCMCAYVVLELALKDPAVLDEWVSISKLADSTPGSTAEVKAGEKVQVRDGLYALMLPSGNDMGNAFAEHFHSRLAPPGEETPKGVKAPMYATRANFIAEMNRTARRLGMTGSTYRIPFGDGGGETDYTTTARDLVKLTLAARKHLLFREVVSAQTHRAQIRMPNKKEREAEWKNSNELLKLSNYDGVKTGTTASAGACLVATGTHEGRGFIVVTLGSASEEARFADNRNLFRWIWTK